MLYRNYILSLSWFSVTLLIVPEAFTHAVGLSTLYNLKMFNTDKATHIKQREGFIKLAAYDEILTVLILNRTVI